MNNQVRLPFQEVGKNISTFKHKMLQLFLFASKQQMKKDNDFIYDRLLTHGIPNALNFDFENIRDRILTYVQSMQVVKPHIYKYSSSTLEPNIYASVYACLIRSLLGDIGTLNDGEKIKWKEYFDSFQSKDNGLFYDPVIRNEIYDQIDWWGARHLALHVATAYNALGFKPKYQFRFLEEYYDTKYLRTWLNNIDWTSKFSHADDIDNKIMNIACLMQYSKDYFGDSRAGKAVKLITDYLRSRINPITGMWGNYVVDDPSDLSRMVQFAYHLLVIFFYDGIKIDNHEKIIDFVLKTQNKLGGYGVKLNSSACEDIDSIYLLMNLANQSGLRKDDVKSSLFRAFPWVLSNMNDDGGFVFRRNEPFIYGHKEMSSGSNQSSMFATWFRTLSIAYLARYLIISNSFKIGRTPGYEYYLI